MKMATPKYMTATKSSAPKCTNKTSLNKLKIGHQQWNASPKIENPDGPIKPLPSINNYKRKMDAMRKKHAELLNTINANKKQALGFVHSLHLSTVKDQMLKDMRYYSSKSIYSSLPPMGNEEEFIQKYSIDKDDRISIGGSSVVYPGRRLSDDKKVAIKKIKQTAISYWGSVNGQIYPIEYCHLRMLAGSSRIANLLDAFDLDDEIILVLETMDKCSSIADLFRPFCSSRAPIPETRCKIIFRQLFEAVDHCHKSGIFHRDIKLANILLEENTNEVKLIDFDISALACYSPFEDNPGTKGYVSPEMCDRSVKYEGSPAAVYSMGVVLYDMIFCARSWELLDDGFGMPKVSIDCLDLISKMTATRPEDRLPFDKIIDHPWMQSAAIKDKQSILSKINDESPFGGTKANPGYMSSTITNAAKNRNKTSANKSTIGDHQVWNASPKLENPDGPVKPLPPMNNYRAKIEAPRKKHAELLKSIKANKQQALGLINSYDSRTPDEEQFERIDGRPGMKCKDNNIYSSLPPMGDEEDFFRLYINEDKLIGKGSSCLVYRGRRRSDNKEVAIKKINKSKTYDWGSVNGQIYPIEYCHLRMLDGCNRIANLLDAFDTGDEYIFILETMYLCSSLDICLRITREMKEPHCKLIFRQLVEAVEHCHKSGIFHRDIKTDNILLNLNRDEIKLIDFDLSVLACYSPYRDNRGTFGYMSPEMYGSSAAKYEGSPAAVYSMGVVLYDMIFRAWGWELINKRLPMPKVSTDCLDLICKMTASRPEDRIPFEKILDHPWMQSN
jgi:serine/threonine protein kinase